MGLRSGEPQLGPPLLDQLAHLTRPVGAEPVHHHNLTLGEHRGQEPLDVGLENERLVVEPSTAMYSPITPSTVMEAISVVFLPRFLGTLP